MRIKSLALNDFRNIENIIIEFDKGLNITENNMNLSIKTTVGNMNTDMELVKEGKDILIGFNPVLIMDALKVVEDENIDIYLVNSKAPCFIKNKEESYLYIILPVNFNPEDI